MSEEKKVHPRRRRRRKRKKSATGPMPPVTPTPPLPVSALVLERFRQINQASHARSTHAPGQ